MRVTGAVNTAPIAVDAKDIRKVEKKRMSEALRRDMLRQCPASSGGI